MNKINVKTGIQAHSKDKSRKNVKNWEKKTNQNCMYEWKCNQKCEKKLQPNTSQMKKVMFTISAKHPQLLL